MQQTIANITNKIDDLRDNLVCYEQKIDLTLKEIPRDIRSLNNSNFNLSSARNYGIGNDHGEFTYESQLLNHLDRLTNKDRQSNFHSSYRAAHDEGVIDSPRNHPERINNVTSDLLITPHYMVNAPLPMNFHDNLSDKTLKTILNLQSDRAQT